MSEPTAPGRDLDDGDGDDIDMDSTQGAYNVDGARAEPTQFATGPWFAEQQHGASVMALLTRYLERVPSAQPMRFTRITADISRPVPMAPVEVHARALRDGYRVQSLEAEIRHDGVVVARAVATRIRTQTGLVPADIQPPLYPEDVSPPRSSRIPYAMAYASFHECLEVESDGPDEIGNSVTWFRLVRPIVSGERPSPVLRMAAIADLITSSAVRLGPTWVSINPELTLQIEREPTSQWLCNVNRVRFTEDGLGVTSGVMFDTTRRVGSSAKSVLNFPRPQQMGPPAGWAADRLKPRKT